MLNTDDGLDFRLIWLSGQLWSEGISPYSETFFPRYEQAFGQGPNSHFWVYPPYWWIICRPLAMLPFETALLVWNLFNYFLLITSAYLFACLPFDRLAQTSATKRFLSALAVLSIVQATPFALALGQTSFLLLAGVALLLRSVHEHNRALIALGTTLVMLKPNIGIFIVIFLVTRRWTWPPIALVAIAHLSISLMVASNTSLHETFNGFLNNLSDYDAPDILAGQSTNLTGLAHLTDWIGITVPKSVLYGLTILLALVIGFVVHKSFEALVSFSVFCAFLIPLHTYDMIFCFFLVVICSLQSNRVGAILGFAAAALLLRADNLAVSFEIRNQGSMDAFAGSLLASVALAVACIVAVINTIRFKNPE